MDNSEPKRLGDYELLEVVGTGAQGSVYKARCLAADKELVKEGDIVAVKVFGRGSGEPEEDKRFLRQARILAKLDHPGVCRYIDYFIENEGEWDEKKCLVTEFLEGEALSDRIRRFPRGMPWDEVRPLFDQCLAALDFAAQQQVIHRDLKPSNIYITPEGEAKLIDFGIAREQGGEETSTTGFRGSFDFMAPDFVTSEQFRGDEQSDIFSMGVCFFLALTGSLPYPAFGEHAHIGYMQRWHAGEAPRPEAKHGAFRIMNGLKQFVTTSLEPDRDDRYGSFSEMLEGFRKIKPRMVRHKGKDDYELVDMLGRGGFGQVFKARRARDGKFVAIKHLFSGRESGRFIKEARLLQKYRHPDIVEYVDFIEVEGMADDKEYFLVMEHLPGMPAAGLNARIRTSRNGLEPSEVAELFIHYLSALQYLHENDHPIVHRDIKPGNLYAPMGEPHRGKIFDLGIARDLAGTLTSAGMVPGTLEYMAPEFARLEGERGSSRSDLYAMGLSLHEALTGRKALPRLPKSDHQAYIAFVDRAKNPPDLDFSHPAYRDFPRFLEIVSKAINFDPDLRYARAGEMLTDMETMLEETAEAETRALGFEEDETRATLADPALLERLRAHRAAQPDAIPADEIAILREDKSTPEVDRVELAGWEDAPYEDLVAPATPGTPGQASTTPVSILPAGAAEAVPGAKVRKRGPLLAAVAAVVVIFLVGAGIGGFFYFRGGEAEVARGQEPVDAFLAKAAEASVDYIRKLDVEMSGAKLQVTANPGDEVWRQRLEACKARAHEVPAAFDKALAEVVASRDMAKAQKLLSDWSALDSDLAIMGINRTDHTSRILEMRDSADRISFNIVLHDITNGLPRRVEDSVSFAAAETSARAVSAALDRQWVNVPGADEELAGFSNQIAGVANDYLTDLVRNTDPKDSATALVTVQESKQSGRTLFRWLGDVYRVPIEEMEFRAAVYGVTNGSPAVIADSDRLGVAEGAAGDLVVAMERTWENIPGAGDTFAALSNGMVGTFGDYVQALQSDAMDWGRGLREREEAGKSLEAARAEAPRLTRWLGNAYGSALAEVEKDLARYGVFAQRLEALRQGLDVTVGDDPQRELAAAEESARQLQSFLGDFASVPDQYKTLAVGVQSNLVAQLGGYLAGLDRQGIESEGNLEELLKVEERLNWFGPNAAGLIGKPYTELAEYMDVAIRGSEFAKAAKDVLDAIPESIEDDEALRTAEQAVVLYRQLEKREWEGITPQEIEKGLLKVRQLLVSTIENYLQNQEQVAVAKYGNGFDGGENLARLAKARELAPLLVGFAEPVYASSMKMVEAAKVEWERSRAFELALASATNAVPARIAGLADLRTAEAGLETLTGVEKDIQADRWPGLDPEKAQAKVEALRSDLIFRGAAYVRDLEIRARRYDAGENASSQYEALQAVGSEAPRMAELLGPAYQEAAKVLKFYDAAYRFHANVPTVTNSLASGDWQHLVKVAATLRTVADHDWPAISSQEKSNALDPIEEVLTEAARKRVFSLESGAREAYERGDFEMGDDLRDELSGVGTHEHVVALVAGVQEEPLMVVEAARSRAIGEQFKAAERSIRRYRSYLYQVADPSTDLVYRASAEEPPSIAGLPPEPVQGMGALELDRLKAWAKYGPALKTAAGRSELAEALLALASEAGADEEADHLLALERRLLTTAADHAPSSFPLDLIEDDRPSEVLRWRAHANYQPARVSNLDVLRDLRSYAESGRELNEFDTLLALFACYHCWNNTYDGEGDYARHVRDALGAVLSRTDDQAETVMGFLADYIDEEPDGPGRYLMNALALENVSSNTVMRTEASKWLEANGEGNELVQDRLDLLKKLLEG